jgi:hypothetical protein
MTTSFQCHGDVSSCLLRLAAASWFMEFGLNSLAVPCGICPISFRRQLSSEHRFGLPRTRMQMAPHAEPFADTHSLAVQTRHETSIAALNLSGRTFVCVCCQSFTSGQVSENGRPHSLSISRGRWG